MSKTTKSLPQNFINWASSLSGCDGGNPAAPIWISGIEWGFKEGDPTEYYTKTLPAEIAQGEYTPSFAGYDWKDSLTYTYGRSAAKLYCAIKGENIANYKEVIVKCDGSEIFRTNLYPIAFSSTDALLWKKYKLDELTGFAEKHLFKTWCFLHRFSSISKIVKERAPKLIIGTGVSYLTDFFACYAGAIAVDKAINMGEIAPDANNPNGKARQYYWARLENGTTLVVVPFFSSQSGLNSDYLLQEMGKVIGALVSSPG